MALLICNVCLAEKHQNPKRACVPSTQRQRKIEVVSNSRKTLLVVLRLFHGSSHNDFACGGCKVRKYSKNLNRFRPWLHEVEKSQTEFSLVHLGGKHFILEPEPLLAAKVKLSLALETCFQRIYRTKRQSTSTAWTETFRAKNKTVRSLINVAGATRAVLKIIRSISNYKELTMNELE
jgi:hypothetical protein